MADEDTPGRGAARGRALAGTEGVAADRSPPSNPPLFNPPGGAAPGSVSPPAGSTYAQYLQDSSAIETGRLAWSRSNNADLAQLTAARTTAESAGDADAYYAADRDISIRQVDMEASTMPAIATSGNYENGDFRSYLASHTRFSQETPEGQAELARNRSIQRDYINQVQAENTARMAGGQITGSSPLADFLRQMMVHGSNIAVDTGSAVGAGAAGMTGAARLPVPRAATNCTTCNGAAAAASRATPNDPGASPGSVPANRPLPGAARLDPALRARVDAMQRGDVLPLTRGGKNGLLEHLSTMEHEYGVYRTPDGQMYLTRGTVNEVPPRTYGDRLVFHNHPDGSELSGRMFPGAMGYSTGDLGYIQHTVPEQRSTVLGRSSGITRPSVPRASQNPQTDWDAIDRMFEGITPSR